MKIRTELIGGRVGFKGPQGEAAVESKFFSINLPYRRIDRADEGIDGLVEIQRASGTPIGEFIGVQVKTGKSHVDSVDADPLIYREYDHLDDWLEYALPVLVVVHLPEVGTYWEVVREENVERTSSGGKIAIPKSQEVNQKCRNELVEVGSVFVPPRATSIVKVGDTSHGAAKRYSARIQINGELRKPQIASEIRRRTWEIRGSEYHRNSIVEARWANEDAKCVWLYLYPTREDVRDDNPICWSQWIDPELDERFRPDRIEGEHIGDNIVVNWVDSYEERANYAINEELAKGEYLERVKDLKSQLEEVVSQLREIRAQHSEGTLTDAEFVERMREVDSQLTPIYREGSDLGFPPVECEDFDDQFQCLLVGAHRAVEQFLFGDEIDQDKLKDDLDTALEKVSDREPKVEYELGKVTS